MNLRKLSPANPSNKVHKASSLYHRVLKVESVWSHEAEMVLS